MSHSLFKFAFLWFFVNWIPCPYVYWLLQCKFLESRGLVPPIIATQHPGEPSVYQEHCKYLFKEWINTGVFFYNWPIEMLVPISFEKSIPLFLYWFGITIHIDLFLLLIWNNYLYRIFTLFFCHLRWILMCQLHFLFCIYYFLTFRNSKIS